MTSTLWLTELYRFHKQTVTILSYSQVGKYGARARFVDHGVTNDEQDDVVDFWIQHASAECEAGAIDQTNVDQLLSC